jgi:hypothetical protein
MPPACAPARGFSHPPIPDDLLPARRPSCRRGASPEQPPCAATSAGSFSAHRRAPTGPAPGGGPCPRAANRATWTRVRAQTLRVAGGGIVLAVSVVGCVALRRPPLIDHFKRACDSGESAETTTRDDGRCASWRRGVCAQDAASVYQSSGARLGFAALAILGRRRHRPPPAGSTQRRGCAPRAQRPRLRRRCCSRQRRRAARGRLRSGRSSWAAPGLTRVCTCCGGRTSRTRRASSRRQGRRSARPPRPA